MEKLKEHRIFRDQLIVGSLVVLSLGFFISVEELIAFGIIFGLLAVFNIFTYRQNKKDLEKL